MELQITEAFVTIGSVNLEQLVTFYRGLLSQEPITWFSGVYAEFQVPGLRLGIFAPRSPAPATAHHPTAGLALCLEVQNLAAAIAHLTALGYPPPGEIITASHGQEIYAYDPDGNSLILHQAKGAKGTPREELRLRSPSQGSQHP